MEQSPGDKIAREKNKLALESYTRERLLDLIEDLSGGLGSPDPSTLSDYALRDLALSLLDSDKLEF